MLNHQTKTKPSSILVIDDDKVVTAIIESSLMQEGYQVYLAHDGQAGLREMYNHRPDLVILDLVMPNMDGWTTCARIRQVSDVPIIMLTARGQEEDIVRGLDEGADEYIVKPFDVGVLKARVRAVLRRATLVQTPQEKPGPLFHDGHLTYNPAERRVLLQGKPVRLTPTEYNLLSLLIEKAGKVLSYQELLEKVWGWEYVNDIDYLRVYIWHLRRKLELDAKNPHYIHTEHGIGYRFEPVNHNSGRA